MPKTSDLVIGVTGLATIALAVFGLVVTEARSGPYELPLGPAELPLQVEGGYAATASTGTTGPAGVCIPDTPGGTCAPARLSLDLKIDGLPMVAGAAYHAFLTDGAAPLWLGALQNTADGDVLRLDEAMDARAYGRVVVALETAPEPEAPGPLVVYTRAVEAGQAIDLTGTHPARILDATGVVHVAQIGAVDVSATAAATVEEVTVPDGWTLRSWFHMSDGRYVALETLDVQDGVATAGARVERIDVADIERFVVTLDATTYWTATPQGFPAFVAEVP